MLVKLNKQAQLIRETWRGVTHYPGGSHVMGLTIHQKSSGTVVEFFPVLWNVPLPFWPVSTFPNTIFGIKRSGGE